MSQFRLTGSRRGLAIVLTLALARPALADEFQRHAVVAQEQNAAEVGRDVLRGGGNAIDAAVATAFALAVTHPAAGNLGGGGFLVYFDAKTKQVTTFDFREAAPAAATERMYLDESGALLRGHRNGARAAGVPGTVRGLELAHKKYGTKAWKELVLPAERLAREGFVLTPNLARALNFELGASSGNRLGAFPTSRAAFAKPDATPWKAGDRLVQPDLAQTLERIASDGADGFYKGRTADLIADYCKANGGIITRSDLADYQAHERPATHVTFRGHDVYGVGPPSSGGVVIGLALNILEPFDLKGYGSQSPEALHLVTEAMRRAFLVRALELGDPDFTKIDVARLVSKEYAKSLSQGLDLTKATPSAALAPDLRLMESGNHTTHFSVVDADGNAVALTYTLEDAYGGKAVVAGAGFLLNNEMGDFNLIPGRTDTSGHIGTSANLIAPGKRMLSSQSPTILLKDGRVRLVTGSPGGRTIPNTVLWMVLQVAEFGQPLERAMLAPRSHHQWFPDVLLLEGRDWDEKTLEKLRSMGHTFDTGAVLGVANSIEISLKTGTIHGVPDKRAADSHAAGD